MTYNIQYKYKPANVTPGPKEGQEMCIHRGLTEYCEMLKVPAYVLQIWEGSGEEASIVNYVLVDVKEKKPIFEDHRYSVIEYIIENISKSINNSDVEESNTSSN